MLIKSAYLKVRSSFFFHVIDMPMACVMIEKEIKAGPDIFSCGLIHFIYSSILKLVKCFSPGSPTCTCSELLLAVKSVETEAFSKSYEQ